MGDFFKVFGGLALAGAVLFGVVVGGNALGFWQYSLYAPKYEAVRNEVFKNSQAYNDGVMRDLRDYQTRYAEAKDPNVKMLIRSQALDRVADYDTANLPSDLREFVADLRSNTN